MRYMYGGLRDGLGTELLLPDKEHVDLCGALMLEHDTLEKLNQGSG